MKKVIAKYVSGSLKAVALTTLAMVGLSLSSTPSFAQATYHYTGLGLTPFGPQDGGVLYSSQDHVTATLQFNAYLAGGLTCADVTANSGFRLLTNDGVNLTLDTADPEHLPPAIVRVSTDSKGNITDWYISYAPFFDPIVGVVSSASPTQCFPGSPSYSPIYTDCVSVLRRLGGGQHGESRACSTAPGTWSSPSPPALVSMLISEFRLGVLPDSNDKLTDQLQDVVDDLRHEKNDACRELRAFAYEVTAQSGTRFSPTESAFVLQTVEIIETELNCGGRMEETDLHRIDTRHD